MEKTEKKIKPSRLELRRREEKKNKTTEVKIDNVDLEKENEVIQAETLNFTEDLNEESINLKEESEDLGKESETLNNTKNEENKNTIHWFRIVRCFLIAPLLFLAADHLLTLGMVYKVIFVNKENETNLKFDSIKPSVYATGTSYYKNEEIEKRIKHCLDVFKKTSALSKMDSTNINDYYKFNRERFLLISGQPGIGKTFCVKSIIGEMFGAKQESENWKCIEMKPDILLNKYSGHSELALRNIFKEIATEKDCKYILIFDECDDLITYRGNKNKEEMLEAPNYGGSIANNIVTNYFLNLISTNDEIVSLPFICIFITNKEVDDIANRVKNKFKTVEIKLTEENIKEVITNYLADPLNKFKFTLNSQELNKTFEACKGLSVQRVIEVLHAYATENKQAYSFDKFLVFIKKKAEQKIKREDNFKLSD